MTLPLSVKVASVLALGLATVWYAGPGGTQRHGRGGRELIEPGMTDQEMRNIRLLVHNHRSITRKVVEIPGGVRTRTTTSIPELVPVLREHVRQMERRIHEGRPIRLWDPVFRGVFKYANVIELRFSDVERGIEVMETSDDPVAEKFIRKHAEKVNEFVAKGVEAVRPPWAGGPARRKGR